MGQASCVPLVASGKAERTRKITEAADLQLFSMALKPVPLRGEPWSFIGWRRIIYYHANTPRGVGARSHQKEEKWRKSCKFERNVIYLQPENNKD